MNIVVSINAGSSSIKFASYGVTTGSDLELRVCGKIESIGIAPHLIVRGGDGSILGQRNWSEGSALTHEQLLGAVLGVLHEHSGGSPLMAVGHRIVHGGTRYSTPVRLDEGVLAELDTLCPLAPLHQPHNLAAVRALRAIDSQLRQIGCFDTAFHHGKPGVASRLPLPRAYHDQGLRRYGFHGLSYEFVSRQLAVLDPDLARGRVIAAHLGNGASLCAMQAGRSIDTTMGFTALDGLMMGTRCGQIDPGVVLHLQSELGISVQEVTDLLYHRSGLLGVSGLSSDMRILLDSDTAEAREAIELFVWRAVREFGALAASLGGLDAIVFTAGIGENSAAIRSAICERLGWLGVRLDPAANERGDQLISTRDSRVAVLVIATDEERMIAQHMLDAMSRPAPV